MNYILGELEKQIKEAIEYLKSQLGPIRGGRPTPKLVEDISVDYYGQKLSIKQMGAISVLPPREIQISVWDKNAVGAVSKAIETSNLNVNANTEGNLIRINLPPLSEERRQEFIKLVKKEAEGVKIRIRSARDEANKKTAKDFDEGKLTEDEKFKSKEKIQEIVDKANEEVENILEGKIKEIEE